MKDKPKKQKKIAVEEIKVDLDAFFKDFPDRNGGFATIVVGAAKVDSCVLAMLDAFLTKTCTTEQILDARRGVLGSFAARAGLCYSLGLISKLAYTDMMTLADLRNYCAHNHTLSNFDDEYVKEKCASLKWILAWLARNQSDQEEYLAIMKFPHVIFTQTISILCSELLAAATKVERRIPFVEEGRSNFYAKLRRPDGSIVNPQADRLPPGATLVERQVFDNVPVATRMDPE